MLMEKEFSIIVPCYNELTNLPSLVDAVKKINAEFILVENGSRDESRDYFNTINEPNIKKVYVDVNQGYGYGIKQGLKVATGDYIGWMHADMQVNPSVLDEYFKETDTECFIKAKRLNRHAVEYFFTWGMGVFETILFKKRMKEVMAVPVLFDKHLIDDIDELPDDFSIDIYAYVKAVNKGYSVKYIPVELKDRQGGKSSWNTGILSRIKQSKKMIDASIRIKKECRYI